MTAYGPRYTTVHELCKEYHQLNGVDEDEAGQNTSLKDSPRPSITPPAQSVKIRGFRILCGSRVYRFTGSYAMLLVTRMLSNRHFRCRQFSHTDFVSTTATEIFVGKVLYVIVYNLGTDTCIFLGASWLKTQKILRCYYCRSLEKCKMEKDNYYDFENVRT